MKKKLLWKTPTGFSTRIKLTDWIVFTNSKFNWSKLRLSQTHTEVVKCCCVFSKLSLRNTMSCFVINSDIVNKFLYKYVVCLLFLVSRAEDLFFTYKQINSRTKAIGGLCTLSLINIKNVKKTNFHSQWYHNFSYNRSWFVLAECFRLAGISLC